MKKIKNVAVIGSGFSGLVSSVLLSRAGLDVTLLERNEQVAPLICNFDYDGFQVSHGFHYIGGYYPGGALYRSFEHLGINGRLRPVAVNNAGFDRFLGVMKDDLVVPVGIENVQLTMERAYPRSRPALTEYFRMMKDVFREFSFFSLKEYWFKVGSTLLNISLDEFLRGQNAEPSLIHFLSSYTEMLMGVTAKEVSLLTHLLGIGAYFYSAHTFEGGGGAIARALEDEARASGVRIVTGCDVVKIVCDHPRRLKGLRLRSRRDGRELLLDADACISTIHPKRLLPLLPESPSFDDYARTVSGYEDTRAVGLFHLAVERKIAEEYSSNIHQLARDDSGELKHRITLLPDFGSAADSSASEKRISILVRAWGNESRKACPQRASGWCLDNAGLSGTGTDPSEPDYFGGLRHSMETQLEKTFPELKGRYRIIGALSPCHLDRLNATWNGSIYGLKCSMKRLGSSTFRPLPELYLAGQSVVAPGIFGTLVSAYLASNRITRRIA